MKSTSIKYIIYLACLLYGLQAMGQDEETVWPKKLDFVITTSLSDSIAESSLFDLNIEIDRSKIRNPRKLYVKVLSQESNEVNFIRGIDREVLNGSLDVKTWEQRKNALEKQWEQDRLTVKKRRKKSGDEAVQARYVKQRGRELQKTEVDKHNAKLKFGPFSPGDYKVNVRVMDGQMNSYTDTHNITISSEVEPSN